MMGTSFAACTGPPRWTLADPAAALGRVVECNSTVHNDKRKRPLYPDRAMGRATFKKAAVEDGDRY